MPCGSDSDLTDLVEHVFLAWINLSEAVARAFDFVML